MNSESRGTQIIETTTVSTSVGIQDKTKVKGLRKSKDYKSDPFYFYFKRRSGDLREVFPSFINSLK